MKSLPNILTGLRLVLCLAMFAALLAIGSARWPGAELALARFAFAAYVIAAVTDFFDGFLARRWNVVSTLGAILDPIADKVLVCGAILGLLAVAVLAPVPLPGLVITLAASGGVILFREFAVSALREVLAPRGIKLPVTFLAKAKTTLQLVTLGGLMVIMFWPAWRIDATIPRLRSALATAEVLFAVAAVVTLWTGLEYGRAAWRALREA